MRRTDWLVAAALALCLVGLVACGGDGANGDGESAAREEAALEFTECMRARGVEMPDPQPGEEGAIDLGDAGIDPNDPATKEALGACDEKLEKVAQDVSPEEDEEFREGWLAFSACVREEGIEMGDPRFLGPGKMLLDVDDVDTESPAFEAAVEACEGEAPEGVDGGVGG